MLRFYRLDAQRNLFGGACLVREWGRIGTSGRVMIETHADEGKEITALAKIAAVKRKWGYVDPATSTLVEMRKSM